MSLAVGEREPPRQVWHLFLLIGVVVAMFVSSLVSQRPLMIASFNNVAPAGNLPGGIDVIDDWDVTIHRSDWTLPIARLLGRSGEARPVRLGWVIKEWSLMSLPLVAWRQSDLVAFREDSYGYRLVGLTADQRRAVTAAGAPWFPWWRYVWGWLAVAALAGAIWGELGWQARRRELLGLM